MHADEFDPEMMTDEDLDNSPTGEGEEDTDDEDEEKKPAEGLDDEEF